jgi:hypothetical protein
MSGFGEKAIKLAARLADGYRCVQPNADFVRLYRESGGGDRPAQGGLKVCWGTDEMQARKTMHRLWSNDEIPGEAAQLPPLPRHFGQLADLVSEDMISAPCGPGPAVHVEGVRADSGAGFDEVYIGQVGPDYEGFFESRGPGPAAAARGLTVTRPRRPPAAGLAYAGLDLCRVRICAAYGSGRGAGETGRGR